MYAGRQATPDSEGSLPPEAATGSNAADDAPGLSATGSALSSAAVSDGGHPGRRRAVLPALLDRVDDVVYLKPLGEAHLGEVVRMQVRPYPRFSAYARAHSIESDKPTKYRQSWHGDMDAKVLPCECGRGRLLI